MTLQDHFGPDKHAKVCSRLIDSNMKNKIAHITALVFICCAAIASTGAEDANFNSVTLAWDANQETDISGYKIFFSKDQSAWTHVKNLDRVTTATVVLPEPGTWFFVIVAKNTEGLESLPSNVVEYTTPTAPEKPGRFRIVSAVATQVSTVTTSTNIIIVP